MSRGQAGLGREREVGGYLTWLMPQGYVFRLPEIPEGVVQMYNTGMPRPKPTEKQKNDPLFPTTDSLLKPLNLTKEEQQALIAFLHTLSSTPTRERVPELPE